MIFAISINYNLVVFAQKTSSPPKSETVNQNNFDDKFQNEIGLMAQNYWTPKLNEYKNKIDRTLSTSDLNDLNKLRAKWGVLIGKLSDNAEQNVKKKNVTNNKANVDIKLEDDSDMGNLMEVFNIFSSTQTIAAKYRTDLDKVGDEVIDNVCEFIGNVANIIDKFQDVKSQTSTKIKGEKSNNDGAQDLREIATSLKDVEKRKDISQVYDIAFEPIILLFSGTDLRELLSGMGDKIDFAKPVAGMNIPSGSVLKQNIPNPARGNTVIKYNLFENTSEVSLKLYDANGSEVMNLTQGSQQIGEHDIKVDVSKLSSGSYLYQLKISTSIGDQVYAKTMQVVK